MPVVLHRLDRGRIARTARLHVELQLARAVGAEDRVDQTQPLGVGLQQHGRSTVAEERAGGAVGVVDDRRHLVGTHDDHLLARARLDVLGAGRQGEEEARAGGRYVVGEGVLAACLVGDQVTRRGEEHVGGDRGADHHVDLHRIDAGLVQQVLHGARSHVGGAHAVGLEDVTGLDAGVRGDPLVRGVDHTAQLVVGQKIVGQVLTHARYGCWNLSH